MEIEADSEICRDCGNPLEKKGWEERSVFDTPHRKTEKITFRLAKRYCPHCRRNITSQAPGVLPKSLFGNKLIADAVVMHYIHGLPIGRISEHLGVGAGSIAQLFQRSADLFEKVPDRRIITLLSEICGHQ